MNTQKENYHGSTNRTSSNLGICNGTIGGNNRYSIINSTRSIQRSIKPRENYHMGSSTKVGT